MLTVYLVGSNKENMKKCVEFLCEALAGWSSFVNDEFTVSDVKTRKNGENYIELTMGDRPEHYVIALDYDKMFFENGRGFAHELMDEKLLEED